MTLYLYADPVQGITFTVVRFGDDGTATSCEAFNSVYDSYLDELVATMTVYGNKIDAVKVSGNEAYASKIVQEVKEEYPNIEVAYE